MTGKIDLFAKARETYTVPEIWQILQLPGEPKASCRSPFRDDHTPSLSIFDNGRGWKDHSTGDGGDVVAFLKSALGDYRIVRDWLRERIGQPDGHRRPATAPARRKPIQWPGEILEGTQATWQAFADKRGISFPAAWTMVHVGIIRFTKIDGHKCFIVTDDTRRAAEIRRIDRQPFGTSKAYPLTGCDKTWLPGADLLRDAPPEASVMIVEGATDLLTAFDLYTRYRRSGGAYRWIPCALLGAGCKTLSPECAALMRGRHVRLVPDADEAGDKMAAHWSELLRENGCSVDTIELPRGKDLSDCKPEIAPETIFSPCK